MPFLFQMEVKPASQYEEGGHGLYAAEGDPPPPPSQVSANANADLPLLFYLYLGTGLAVKVLLLTLQWYPKVLAEGFPPTLYSIGQGVEGCIV